MCCGNTRFILNYYLLMLHIFKKNQLEEFVLWKYMLHIELLFTNVTYFKNSA